MNDLKRILVVLLGSTIVCVFTFGVKNHMDSDGYKNQVNYTTAIKVDKQDDFNYAVDSKQGRVLAHGTFTTKTKELAKFDEMTKGFTYVKRTQQHYTPHITCSDKPTTCRTTYSWDYAGSEDKYASTVSLYGREYRTSLFNFHHFLQDADACTITAKDTDTGFFSQKHGCSSSWFGGEYYYLDNDDRYSYDVVPLQVTATFLGNTYGPSLEPFSGDSIDLQDKSIEQVLQDVGKYHLIGFWVLTILLLILIGIGMFIAYSWVMADGEFNLTR